MATYYINADSGNDSTGDGSTGTPWETLAHAYDNSSAGDIIVCQDSIATYAWVADTITSRTIRGESTDASGAVFDAGSATTPKWTMDGGDVTLEYLTFQNSIPQVGGAAMFKMDSNNTFIATNCRFIDIGLYDGDSGKFGIIANDNSSNRIEAVTFTNCLFDNIYFARQTGVYGEVIVGARSMNANTQVTFQGCTIYIPTPPATRYQCNALLGGTAYANLEIKNTIVNNANGDAFQVARCYNVDTVFNVTYSCMYNNVDYSLTLGGVDDTTGTITSDPLMVDPDNDSDDDFNLRPTSPCMGTGALI